MFNADEFYKTIDRKITGELKSTGQMENAFWQHIGKVINHKLPVQGSLYDEIFSNVERKLKGLKKHGFEQNKKTDLQKLIEKGAENESGN